MSDFSVMAFFVALILGCIIILVLLLKPRKKKILNSEVTVKTKRIKRVYVKKMANAGVSGSSWFENYIDFAFEKKIKEYQVPDDVFAAVEEGDRGILTYEGDRFISFEKKS